jgi:Na+/alanine symporter
MAASSTTIQNVFGGVAVIAFYALALWRIVKRNQGNRVIECGSIALVAFFIMAALVRVPNLPDWIVPALGILFLLLGFLMILFLIQQGYNAIRHKIERLK